MENVKNILVGFTENKEVVSFNINVRKNNEFSMTCDVNRIFTTDYENCINVINDSIKYDYDNDTVLELLKEYDCHYSELANEIYYNDGVYAAYPGITNELDIKGYTFYFELIGCGQCCDTPITELVISEELYNYLINLWNTKHLQRLTLEEIEQLNTMLNSYDIDEKQCITSYILDNFDI